MENKRKNLRKILTVAALVIFALLLCACAESGTVNENKTEQAYTAVFEAATATKTHGLNLRAGDSLSVAVSLDGGDIRLSIADPSGVEIYAGNALVTTSFTIDVHSDGVYTVTLTLKKASGQVGVIKFQNQ
ncbi:MAG: hypothetical protein ACOX3U_02100 [Christensenellales bacterium]|jgi:ABC-type oligopeptide transport system substrate-binding subunit